MDSIVGMMKSIRTLIVITAVLLTGCKRFEAEEYYAVSTEDVDEISIDFQFVKGNKNPETIVITGSNEIDEFLKRFQSTEINRLTDVMARYTTSLALIRIRHSKDRYLYMSVGLIKEDIGFIVFEKRNGMYSSYSGRKFGTKFAKYVFSLLPNNY